MSDFMRAWYEVKEMAHSEGFRDECDIVDAELVRLCGRVAELERCLAAESGMVHTLNGECGLQGELLRQRAYRIEELEEEIRHKREVEDDTA